MGARGLSAVKRNLGRAVAQIEAGASRGVRNFAESVVPAAQARTPVRSGLLRESFVVSEEETDAGPVAAVANTAPYAPRVHEDLSMQHRNGGEAKFLERALDEEAPRLPEMIKREVGL
jgi:hypothetical protein